MSRLLFWIAFIILVVMAVRAKLREATGARPQQRRAPDPDPAPAQVAEPERMACCAHCGLYFPASEAVRADGRDYCSPAHVQPHK